MKIPQPEKFESTNIPELLTAIVWGDTKGWIDPLFKKQDPEAEDRRRNWEREKDYLFKQLGKKYV